MQKRKKKKHPEDFTGKTVSWKHEDGRRLGVVERQTVILDVLIPGGETVMVRAKEVVVEATASKPR